MKPPCSQVAHRTKKAAQRALRRERAWSRRELWVSRCSACGRWHLTSVRPWRFKPLKKRRSHNYGRGRRPLPGESIEALAERMKELY